MCVSCRERVSVCLSDRVRVSVSGRESVSVCLVGRVCLCVW